jgi:hypothetical protein
VPLRDLELMDAADEAMEVLFAVDAILEDMESLMEAVILVIFEAATTDVWDEGLCAVILSAVPLGTDDGDAVVSIEVATGVAAVLLASDRGLELLSGSEVIVFETDFRGTSAGRHIPKS